MKRKGSTLLAVGVLCITAALLLVARNLYDQRQAAQSAQQAAERLTAVILESTDGEPLSGSEAIIPDYLLDVNREMPTETVDGLDYIGILRIPALTLELPVISEWSETNLKTAPCRYSGSAYLDDLTICAHNYASHFGSLRALPEGSDVTLTDMDGNVFHYQTAAVEILPPTAIEDMTDSGWALTLFTCTVGGQSRVAVRCEKAA